MPPEQPQNQMQPQAQIAGDPGVQAPQLDPARLDAFKKSLAHVWAESLGITGLPVDVLLQQVSINASEQGLEAKGSMLITGAGQGFAPSQETMAAWINSYFNRVTGVSPAQLSMPEA